MRSLAAFVLFFILSAVVFGQATTSLTGTVTDPSGAVIPGASLTLISDSTGAQREDKSDAQGRYSFQQLAPGNYHLVAKATGFADVTVNAISLLVNTPATLPVTFEKVGTVAESVSVTAESIQVNTQDASLGNAIGGKAITQVPLEARNVVGLLALQPGVTYISEPEPGLQPDFRSGNVNGGKSDQANVTLDGIDVNDQQNRSPFTSVLRVTLDSVQEFRTITTNSGADFGRTSGAQVALVTKSGTNTIHGSVYEYLRNTLTSANDFFSNAAGSNPDGSPKVPRAKLNRNLFGMSLGGPIKKDRLFYFINYEGRRDRSETVSPARTVPTADFRQGIFTYTKKDGTTGKLTPDQVRALDPAGIGASTAVLNFLKSYPLPNSNSVGDSLNSSGFIFNYSTPLDFNTYTAKFDYKLDNNGRHTLFWRGSLQNDYFANGLPNFPGDPPSSVFLQNNKGYAIGYTTILTPNFISNFHYGYTRQGFETTGFKAQANARMRDLTDRFSQQTGLARITPLHQFSEDLSWVKGAHTVAFGGVIRLISNSRASTATSFSDALSNVNYLLGSGSGAGGNYLAPDAANTLPYKRQFNNLLGVLTQLNRAGNYDLDGNLLPEGSVIKRRFVDQEYEMYLQDTWKTTKALTITAGLRVSLSPPVHETQGYQVSPSMSLEDWFNLRGSLAAQGKPQSLAPPVSLNKSSVTGRGLYPFQHDFAPRLALAYSPQGNSGLSKFLFGGPGRSAIRAGFGMYYDLFGQSIIRQFDATALGFSSSINNTADADARTFPRFTDFFSVPFGFSKFPTAPATSKFPQVYPDVFDITNSLDDKIKSPYTMNIDFSIQREFRWGILVQASYVGRLSRRSLIKDDLAMPTNLIDSKSGMTYRQAAGQLTAMILAGVPTSQVAKIPFFENLYSPLATSKQTATQAVYDVYADTSGDWTTALANLEFCDDCSILGPNSMFNSQFGSLVALRSVGSGSYHAMQWTVRKRFSSGIQFDLNYTYSKSIDLGSLPENNQQTPNILPAQTNSTSIINSWFSNDMKAVSSYDVQHMFSAFLVAELPFGQGKRFGNNVNRGVDAIIGGWSINSVFHNSSGYPVGILAAGIWPTNWQVGSFANQTGVVPAPHTTKNAPAATASGTGGPNIFSDPKAALAAYDIPLAGDSGQRNGIRGDGVFSLDLGVAKQFHLFTFRDQPHTLQFRADSFNVTNSVRFDPYTVNNNIFNAARFGQYTSLLTKPRVFQFALRYEF